MFITFENFLVFAIKKWHSARVLSNRGDLPFTNQNKFASVLFTKFTALSDSLAKFYSDESGIEMR
jgi:hypothetical protein